MSKITTLTFQHGIPSRIKWHGFGVIGFDSFNSYTLKYNYVWLKWLIKANNIIVAGPVVARSSADREVRGSTKVWIGTLWGLCRCKLDILGRLMLSAHKTGSGIISPWRHERWPNDQGKLNVKVWLNVLNSWKRPY